MGGHIVRLVSLVPGPAVEDDAAYLSGKFYRKQVGAGDVTYCYLPPTYLLPTSYLACPVSTPVLMTIHYAIHAIKHAV